LIAAEVASTPQVSEHPAPDVLRDFMAGKLSWEATKWVVRHLLAGCRRCSVVTRHIWDFAEEPLEPVLDPLEGGEP
jgi:hypothetical protein